MDSYDEVHREEQTVKKNKICSFFEIKSLTDSDKITQMNGSLVLYNQFNLMTYASFLTFSIIVKKI